MVQGDSDQPSSLHTLADHAFGSLADHRHDGDDHDHDHDHEFSDDVSVGLSSVPLLSIGIDIGSSSTQVIFTRLDMRGPSAHRALRRQIKERETLYMSAIMPTPFDADRGIDEHRLWDILANAFSGAGLTPDDVETGVLILTGEAAVRENAQVIAQTVARACGDVVCAAAGHHMEAALAAYGSGLVDVSREGMGQCLLNIDIGGGTTKFAIVEDGHIRASAAMRGGGRLLVVDRAQRIVRLEKAGEFYAQRAGYQLALGDRVDDTVLHAIAQVMADAILKALTDQGASDVQGVWLTDALPHDWLARVQGVRASGGVAEFIYQREHRDFWDLGRALGLAFRGFRALPWPLLEAGECIRATAFGASAYSVQLSGQTLYISTPAALLPCRNMPVIQPDFGAEGGLDPQAIARAISAHRHTFDLHSFDAHFALALRWRGGPDYGALLTLAQGVMGGCADMISAGRPLYIIFEGDHAQTFGAILRDDLKLTNDVLVIDGITLRDFDYIDIGRIRLPSYTVPVTVKSLLFGAVQKKIG
jgi:ethanolamine utilization protein EutA